MAKDKWGRPTKKTEEVEKKLIEQLQQWIPRATACHFCDITLKSLQNRLKDDEVFSQKILQAEAYFKHLIQEWLLHHVKEQDKDILKFCAKAHMREIYGDKVQHSWDQENPLIASVIITDYDQTKDEADEDSANS